MVLADWIFTAPAVVLQLATGLWLTSFLQISYGSAWLIAVLTMFALVGACWLPVVWIQIKLNQLVNADVEGTLPRQFSRWMRVWIALGVPAFLLTLVLVGMMVFKPGINWIVVGAT